MPRKRIKVLYVCPFAHYAGHPPTVAIHETAALARAGVDVTLLTFYGIIGKTEVKVPHMTVLKQLRVRVQYMLNLLFTRWALFRWPIMVLENFWTVAVAIQLKKKLDYDIILLRDGDPFLFVPFLLSLTQRNLNWAVFLNGGIILAKPSLSASYGKMRMFIYKLAVKFINSKLWKPIYRQSMARNHFTFPIPGQLVKQIYDSYLQGIFSDKTIYITPGVSGMPGAASKQDARRRLGLPQRRPLFLSFGVSHPGKDFETALRAVKDIPNIFLVQAGTHSFSVGQNPTALAQDYAGVGGLITRDYYIPEEEKPYYFFAADAVILSYTRQFLSATSLLLETCLYNTPVIASDNGEQGEIVKAFQLGLLFKAQDAGSLREAIIQFINLKTEEIELLRENCRRFSEGFSIDKMARELLGVFKHMLSST